MVFIEYEQNHPLNEAAAVCDGVGEMRIYMRYMPGICSALFENTEAVFAILAQSHIFVEIDHEIISMDILLPSAESFKKGCCQLQAKVCASSTG